MKKSKHFVLSFVIISGLILGLFPLPQITSANFEQRSTAPAKTGPTLEALPNSVSSEVNQEISTTASNFQNNSPAPASVVQQIAVALRPNNEAKLKDFLQAVQNPASPQYKRFLTPSEFRRQFGASDLASDQLKKYFAGYNLQLTYESQDGLLLTFNGTRANLDQAFNTTSRYETNKRGESGFRNITPLQLPSKLAPFISGVTGLDAVTTARSFAHAQARATDPQILAGGPTTPAMLRAAYNLPNSLTGRGRTVAVTLWGAPSLPDLTRWQSYFGTPLNLKIIPDTARPATNEGLRFEANMDVQMIQTAAPEANIRFYVANSNSLADLLTTLSQAVSDGADAVSSSWGACEPSVPGTTVNAYHTLFQTAAALGTTVIFASGDSGIYECNYQDDVKYVGFSTFPASDEFVTAVGGTSLSYDGVNWSESGWSCDATFDVTCNLQNSYGSAGGSGGGVAIQQPRPAYQNNFTPPAQSKFPFIAGLNPSRVTPDISFNADPAKGLLVFFKTADFATPATLRCADDCAGGGTSASAPFLAGLVALMAQASQQLKPGRTLPSPQVGQLNPFLYQNRNLFGSRNGLYWGYDVTSGYNGVNAQVGWDYVTGLGSIADITAFITNLSESSMVQVSGVWLNDSGNPNPDMVASPGDAFALQIDLTNYSASTVISNVSGTLSLVSGAASIRTGFSGYPDIVGGQTVTNQKAFVVAVDAGAPCGERLRLRLTVDYETPSNIRQTFTYDFSVSVGNRATTFSNVPVVPLTIPDNTGASLSIPLTVSTPISDFRLQVSIQHPDVSQLELSLLTPNGITLPLSTRQGSGPNFSLTVFDDLGSAYVAGTPPPYADAVRPEANFALSLSIVPTSPVPAGVWKLQIIDKVSGGVGQFRNAALIGLQCICPGIRNVSPSYVVAGGASFTMTIDGEHFNGVSEVNWSGNYRPATVTGPQQLKITINPADISTTRPVSITIFNPGGGNPNTLGCNSNTVIFLVVSSLPMITKLSQVFAPGPSPSYWLYVYGQNFTPNTVVRWGNNAGNTTFIDSTTLSTTIPIPVIDMPGRMAITAFNTLDGRLSNSVPFQLGCNPLLVNKISDDGSCNTFRTAAFFARYGPIKNIVLFFTYTPTITLSGQGINLAPGVRITGQCAYAPTLDGTGIRGDGLILNGSNYVQGLKIKGFNGRQIVNFPGATGNQLSCVSTSRS